MIKWYSVGPFRRSGVRVAWLGYERHLGNGGHGKLKPLTGFKAGRADDLHLDQRLVPLAHAVDGFAAQADLAPQFTDSELSARRDSNLLSGGMPVWWSQRTKSWLPFGTNANLSSCSRSILQGGADR